MVKDLLTVLMKRDYKVNGLHSTIAYITENYNETQLEYLLTNGMNINGNDLILYYQHGMGFRCVNINENVVGVKPICGVLERALNNKISERYDDKV